MRQVEGIVTDITGSDEEWMRTTGNRVWGTRYAYRSLDNRWGLVTPTEKIGRKLSLFPMVSASAGWYAAMPASPVFEGPAIHASRHFPNRDLIHGGCRIIRIAEGVWAPHDYRGWSDSRNLEGHEFWLYALAVANHPDYWTEGTERAASLANQTVELPLTGDPAAVAALVGIGRQLVEVWSLDGIQVGLPDGGTGDWQFDGHDDVADVKINGYPVLQRWRKARPGIWDVPVAEEYARTVKALRMLLDLSEQVGELID